MSEESRTGHLRPTYGTYKFSHGTLSSLNFVFFIAIPFELKVSTKEWICRIHHIYIKLFGNFLDHP